MKKIIFVLMVLSIIAFCFSCSCGNNGENSGGSGDKTSQSVPHEHYWDKGKIVKEATKEDPGVMTYTCVVCNLVREESIPRVPHEHIYNEVWGSDTGHHWHSCQVKNCTVKGSKGSHTFGEGEIIKEANQSLTGVKRFTCSVCNFSKEEEYRAKATVTEQEFVNAITQSAFSNVTYTVTSDEQQYTILIADGKVKYGDMVDGDTKDLWCGSYGIAGNFIGISFGDLTYEEGSRAYIYEDASRKLSLQFADGKIVSFVIDNMAQDKLSFVFSSYGRTVIE